MVLLQIAADVVAGEQPGPQHRVLSPGAETPAGAWYSNRLGPRNRLAEADAMTSSDRAGRDWFGYGSWSAPYWFVGMEPGGDGDGASHDSWLRLGGGELIDCKTHHLDCDFTRWHGRERPPTQPTWRRLIQLLLAYKGESSDLDSVARYQLNRLGVAGDETAIIELSAHHAVSVDVPVERTAHREHRIALIQRRLDVHAPRFVVFYGRSYQVEYERVVDSPFGANGTIWRGATLCVLTPHPVAQSGPPPAYWLALGHAIRTATDAGPGTVLAMIDEAPDNAARPRASPAFVNHDVGIQDIPIIRDGSAAGRIIREGKSVRVECLEADGSYRLLGYYERSEPATFPRKAREIDAIFDAWRTARIGDGSEVKVSWRRREFVPAFHQEPRAMTDGCSVVEDDGIPIAYIYKIAPTSAVWVDA